MDATVTIGKKEIGLLCDACKMALASSLGLQPSGGSNAVLEDTEEVVTGPALLGIGEARAFLLGCGEKTTQALSTIVATGHSFSASEIEKAMSAPTGSLRGVWTGLTKRVRTITGDDEADLFDWFEQEEDGSWRGRMAPTTKKAFRDALSE